MNKFVIILAMLLTCLSCHAEIIQDDIATNLAPKPIETYLNYNFESTQKIPIRLKIKEPIHCEKDLYEGQIIDFIVTKDVINNGQIIVRKYTTVSAKVELIITPGMNGIPASVIFGNFKIPNIQGGQLTNSYEIFGQDRSLWVFPLKWALTPLPPTGSLTNFIKGGSVKLNNKQTITLYYYPDWK